MTWNWQQGDWPGFRHDAKALSSLEDRFLSRSGELCGAFKHILNDDKQALTIELISDEALKTSAIEGEYLDRDSLQSSIRRQFGLQTDNRRVPSAEQGLAEMMFNLYDTFSSPLTHEMLFVWHKALVKGRIDLNEVGNYRTHEDPMQIVSGPIYDPVIHFEAPPSLRVAAEMNEFVRWFNNSAPTGISPLPALTRAGIAHLYFASIHPFEDGNGRIARAISEKALAQCLGQPTLIALAFTIERRKKDYYTALAQANQNNEITSWLLYFGKTVLEAEERTIGRIEFIIKKTKFYDRYRGKFNQRQEKVIERLFHEGPDGFAGGLSADKYISIAGTSRATATRDLTELSTMQALTKSGQLKGTRYHLNLAGY